MASHSGRPERHVVEVLPLVVADDAGLARAMIQGHPGAARALWRRFYALVRGLLRRALGPGDEIEDVVQETFLCLFRRITDLREPSALPSFVVGIAMRIARSELRRRRRLRWLRITEDGRVPETAARGTDSSAREAVARLYSILDRVDDDARLVFVLRHVEDLPLDDVADALRCSLATAKRRLKRATRRIVALAKRDPALAAYVSAMPATAAPERGFAADSWLHPDEPKEGGAA